jgi:hypothetical protein
METSGSPSNVSTRLLASVQRLALRQEMNKSTCIYIYIFFVVVVVQQPLVGQDLLTIEASRSHSDTLHLVGLLWTSDQPHAENSI